MPTVPRKVVEKELRSRHCDTTSDGGQHECGRGQWWRAPWGSDFFMPWVDDEGGVDVDVFKRMLAALIRAQPTFN